MTYSALLESEGIASRYLIVLRPRRKQTSWTLGVGSVYYADFDYGHVVGVDQNGVALAEGSSIILSAGQFYYDAELERLYVRMSDSSNPSTKYVVPTYELYVATSDSHWYRDPLDDASRQVYFEPIVKKSPVMHNTSSENLFGFLPVQSTSIVLNNLQNFFDRHLYDSSFNRCDVRMYHCLDTPLDLDNIALVFNGTVKGVQYNQEEVTLSLLDRVDIFSKEYRPTGTGFFNLTDFPSVNPSFVGKCIRTVFGKVDGFVPVNVGYVAENPTTSNNRDWVCISGQANLGSQSKTVGGGTHTTTRTFLTSVTGMNVGDSAFFDRAAGTDEYKLITNVGANFIDHAALATPMTNGDLVKRSFVGNLTIVQQGKIFRPLFGRDYTENAGLGGTVASGFSFSTSLEANLSMPATLGSTDQVFARVYGKKNTATISAAPFGSDDATSGNLASGVVILYELLKAAGIAEAEINTTDFTALASSVTDGVGFSVPETATGKFPYYRNVIADLLATLLLKFFVDNSNKWTATVLAPHPAFDKEVMDDEILRGSIDYDFSFDDVLSEVIVEFAKREATEDSNSGDGPSSKVTASSNDAAYLHKVAKQKTFESLHFKTAEAQTYANRLRYVFGERRGTYSFKSKNRFFDTLLGDTIRVTRTRMPGYDFDNDTDRSRDFVVTDTSKGLKDIAITMDDQKGIEDNSGSW